MKCKTSVRASNLLEFAQGQAHNAAKADGKLMNEGGKQDDAIKTTAQLCGKGKHIDADAGRIIGLDFAISVGDRATGIFIYILSRIECVLA